MTAERSIETYLRKRCMMQGAMVLKMGTVYRGFPDRIVLWPAAQAHFIELKRPKGGRDEKLQKRWQVKLRSMGFSCTVINTKEQVDHYVEVMRRDSITIGGSRTMSLTPKI